MYPNTPISPAHIVTPRAGFSAKKAFSKILTFLKEGEPRPNLFWSCVGVLSPVVVERKGPVPPGGIFFSLLWGPSSERNQSVKSTRHARMADIFKSFYFMDLRAEAHVRKGLSARQRIGPRTRRALEQDLLFPVAGDMPLPCARLGPLRLLMYHRSMESAVSPGASTSRT